LAREIPQELATINAFVAIRLKIVLARD
jgi:hypothetical protein